jgi:3-(3-hydroxy-phenyl)propionate hydroxylase
MDDFRHGRVMFAGDSAHQVSPFGARGANSGVQDAENLAWKLDMVVRGLAPETLLDSYSVERSYAADENILNSTRATDFLTPKSEISKIFRNAVLELASDHAFARPLVNSGRLSVPCVYDGQPLNGLDTLDGPSRTRVGASCVDAQLAQGYLLDRIAGVFTLLSIGADAPDIDEVDGVALQHVVLSDADDPHGMVRERYLGRAPRAVYLLRPDQHVVARWAVATGDDIRAALRGALGKKG